MDMIFLDVVILLMKIDENTDIQCDNDGPSYFVCFPQHPLAEDR